jgi:hypothetical protein
LPLLAQDFIFGTLDSRIEFVSLKTQRCAILARRMLDSVGRFHLVEAPCCWIRWTDSSETITRDPIRTAGRLCAPISRRTVNTDTPSASATFVNGIKR